MKNFSRGAMFGALALFIVLFNVIVFMLPVEHSEAFWAAYGFATLAFLLQILFFELSFGKAKSLKNIFFGYPIAYLGTLYLTIQVLFSAVVILSGALEYQTTIIVSTIILAFTLILLVAAYFAREEITSTEEKVLDKRRYIEKLHSDIEILQAKASEPEAKLVFKKLAETVRFSDPMSAPELAGLENEIEAKTSTLQGINLETGLAEIKQISAEITELLNERNSKTKFLKQRG